MIIVYESFVATETCRGDDLVVATGKGTLNLQEVLKPLETDVYDLVGITTFLSELSIWHCDVK